MFMRKHYRAIAEIIKREYRLANRNPSIESSAAQYVTIDSIKESLANYFAITNPRFDRQKFFDACTID